MANRIPFEILGQEEDLYRDMAQRMFDAIKRNKDAGKQTVFILPVGPTGQYRHFVKMVNEEQLSLKKVTVFNMDEYLNDDCSMISEDDPLSFRGFMNREVYGRIRPDLNVPPEQRFFPKPGEEGLIWEKIQELGGVDLCFGGVGINGHVAFNEPPEDGKSISDEAYKTLGTRVQKISEETRKVNAEAAVEGYIEKMPKWCITIGMKEILSTREIRLYMFREWHSKVLKRALYEEATCKFPVSFLQEHPNAKLLVTEAVAQSL